MSSSLIRGPSAQAASLGPDELLGLKLLRGRVEELLQVSHPCYLQWKTH